MSLIDDFMPSRIKKNWEIVRSDPKKWALFNLKVVQIVLGVLSVLIVWRFIQVIIGFNAGSSAMGMIGRLLIFLFMCIIIYKIYNQSYKPLKARLMHYNNVPQEKQMPKPMNDKEINKAIDNTIKHFKNKEKGGAK